MRDEDMTTSSAAMTTSSESIAKMFITVREWEYRGYSLSVVLHKRPVPMSQLQNHYNGYVKTSKCIPKDTAYSQLEVHGGLTFYQERDGLITYGFDCAHAFDSIDVQNEDYTAKECERLADEIFAFQIEEEQ